MSDKKSSPTNSKGHFSPTIITSSTDSISPPTTVPVIVNNTSSLLISKHLPTLSGSDEELSDIADQIAISAAISDANAATTVTTASTSKKNKKTKNTSTTTTTEKKNGKVPKKTAKNNEKKSEGSIISDNSSYLLDMFKFTDEQKKLDPLKDVFIQYSQIKNDDLVKWYHLQQSPERYKCVSKSCPTHKGVWRRKPAYLILCRRNGNNRDNRPINIEYKCPNCYFQDYGVNLFTKAKNGLENTSRKCANDCGRTLASTYNGNYCYGCKKRIEKYDSGPTISQMVDLTASMNGQDMDEDERAEQIALLQEIYNTDLELEANLKRHGVKAEQIAGYNHSSSGVSSRRSANNNVDKMADPSLDTDMSGVLDCLSDDEDNDLNEDNDKNTNKFNNKNNSTYRNGNEDSNDNGNEDSNEDDSCHDYEYEGENDCEDDYNNMPFNPYF